MSAIHVIREYEYWTRHYMRVITCTDTAHKHTARKSKRESKREGSLVTSDSRACMHTYYIYTCIYTHMSVCVRACILTFPYMYTHMSVCVCACT